MPFMQNPQQELLLLTRGAETKVGLSHKLSSPPFGSVSLTELGHQPLLSKRLKRKKEISSLP